MIIQNQGVVLWALTKWWSIFFELIWKGRTDIFSPKGYGWPIIFNLLYIPSTIRKLGRNNWSPQTNFCITDQSFRLNKWKLRKRSFRSQKACLFIHFSIVLLNSSLSDGLSKLTWPNIPMIDTSCLLLMSKVVDVNECKQMCLVAVEFKSFNS